MITCEDSSENNEEGENETQSHVGSMFLLSVGSTVWSKSSANLFACYVTACHLCLLFSRSVAQSKAVTSEAE
jgi:hypothetical protein